MFFFIGILFPRITRSQDSSKHSSFSFLGYADAYFAYYTDSVGSGDYQKFPSVSPRSNQFGLNVAMASVKYNSDRVRATIALHYGDIPKSAWSSDFNFIQEANAGIRLCKSFWIDGGFFRTHIGTEGLFPRENITSSVAVVTYFEPYYEAGFKFSYAPADKISLNLFLLNGYNLYIDNNKKKSLGFLGTYAINDHVSIGYDNYLGDDSPEGDTSKHFRFYNNAFLNFEKNKIRILTGADFCIHQNGSIENPSKSASMFGGVFDIRYAATKMFDVYGRAEIYQDADGFLSGVFLDKSNHFTGLKIWGATLGAEFKPTENSYVRLEGRDLIANSDQEIFYWNGSPTNTRLEVMINFGVWFP
ncbi:MAG: outer membrane beta-barrel protein [Chitinophagales bacterium]